MGRLVERPTVLHKVHPTLLDLGFAFLAYGEKARSLGLGHPTQAGIDWYWDVKSGGRFGSALFLAWHWEQRALFAESRLAEAEARLAELGFPGTLDDDTDELPSREDDQDQNPEDSTDEVT